MKLAVKIALITAATLIVATTVIAFIIAYGDEDPD